MPWGGLDIHIPAVYGRGETSKVYSGGGGSGLKRKKAKETSSRRVQSLPTPIDYA